MATETDEPRAYTPDEMRALLIEHLDAVATHTAAGNPASADATDLAIFSALAMIDGVAGFMPAFRLIPLPHPDDAADAREQGRNWWPDDVDLADGPRQLHDLWANRAGRKAALAALALELERLRGRVAALEGLLASEPIYLYRCASCGVEYAHLHRQPPDWRCLDCTAALASRGDAEGAGDGD